MHSKRKNYFLILCFLSFVPLLPAQLEDWDSDQDAMPNGYEFYRGLNVDDPRDAWQDPDEDGILNIYEYYLGTDPQDKSQPRIVHLEAGEDLNAMIRTAERGTVIRIPTGYYPLNYRHDSQAEAPRLLLQGGWNTDFTQQDHCRYPTVLSGEEQGALFDLLITNGNSTALLIDGCTLQNGSAGAIQLTAYLSKVQLLLANCRIINNSAHRASAILNFRDGENATLISDLILVNTVLAGNRGTAVRTEQHATRTNLKLLHSLVAFNEYADNDVAPYSSGHGLDVYPDSDSTFYLQIANSILWKNANTEFRIGELEEQTLEVSNTNNLLNFIEEETRQALFAHPSNRSLDPQLESDGDLFFRLAATSPAIAAGVDLGFFPASDPDIGTSPCVAPLTTVSAAPEATGPTWTLYPNPAQRNLHLSGNLAKSQTVEWYLFDRIGRKISGRNLGPLPAGAFHWTLSDNLLLESGIYLLQIKAGKHQQLKRFTIIR
ncbi:T9SS type A sorting domain-containing protein [Flavilitoribacter nigricans]|uniref:Secretion system C-terminal sorting domain-containing protein n=1 Tax=Flavilitoribacter nigricans (strain ATCC 23147 / DSM 23189 / NBRC 102662 / NCIMB 1420 / SS-2) TaxID=1122177 RepID=A0A2D0N0V6_FLAN2|nr:T9SS type A sorting domain-containing protein [Flavilitoribacter nigricans]PHN01779.1 hypothetical protein CRP01_35425 [Flavilitoribacter nigricans DSM 23189 = NBRC 102662]